MNHILAEVGQAIVMFDARFVVAGGVRPAICIRVRERHIANAQREKSRSSLRLSSIAWPPSMPINAAIFPRLCAASICPRVVDELEDVRIPSDDIVQHGIDHLQRAVRRMISFDVIRRDIHGEELRTDAALAQSHDVGVAGAGARHRYRSPRRSCWSRHCACRCRIAE